MPTIPELPAIASTLAAADIVPVSQGGIASRTTVGGIRDFVGTVTVADYATLRAYTGTAKNFYVTGYLVTAAPSGIAGNFTVDDTDTTSADNGVTIIVTSSGKRLKRVYDGAVNIKWVGDITSTTLATAAASGASSLIIPPGAYTIAASVTFTMPVHQMAGAVITVANGQTLAFNKGFSAGVYQCFSLTGTGVVTFDSNETALGLAEWWGAVNTSAAAATTNTAAINAAIAALRTVQLMPGDYYVDSKVHIKSGWRELRGWGERFQGATSGIMTRLLTQSATITVLQIGPDASPGSVNDFYDGIKVSNLLVGRTVAPSIASAACGIRLQYVQYANFSQVKTTEHIYGWHLAGTVAVQLDRCNSFRSLAGAGGGTDTFRGFFVDGSVNIGLNSSNASLEINYSKAEIGNIGATLAANGIGFYFDSTKGFTDAFLETPESTACGIGIRIIGNGPKASYEYTNGNLQIKNPVLDGFNVAGIYATNCNKYGSFEVHGGYYGAAAKHASVSYVCAVFMSNCLGSYNFFGGQAIMVGDAASRGFVIDTCESVGIIKTLVMESGEYAVDASNIRNCDIQPVAQNENTTSTGAVVRLLNTNERCNVQPFCKGAANVFPLGIQLVSTTTTYTQTDPTGLDPATIAGGAGNKVVYNGVQQTVVGAFGTGNYNTGVVA